MQEQRYAIEFSDGSFEMQYPKRVLKDRMTKREFKDIISHLNEEWNAWLKAHEDFEKETSSLKYACICFIPAFLHQEQQILEAKERTVKDMNEWLAKQVPRLFGCSLLLTPVIEHATNGVDGRGHRKECTALHLST